MGRAWEIGEMYTFTMENLNGRQHLGDTLI
jgi:hypothetical protein